MRCNSSPGHRGALCDGLQPPPRQPSPSTSDQPLNLPPPGLQAADEKQTVRHVLLCLLLSVSLLAVRTLKKQPSHTLHPFTPVLPPDWPMCVSSEPVQLPVVAVQQRPREALPGAAVLLRRGQLRTGSRGRSHGLITTTTTTKTITWNQNLVVPLSQGFLSFGIFGLDRHLIILPFKKR